MKKFKSLILSLIIMLAISAGSYAQQQPAVIAVINKADWCPVCKANEQKMMELMPQYMGKNILFVINDLSNDMTKNQSALLLTSLGLSDEIGKIQGTGLITLVDPSTKKAIDSFSIAGDPKDIMGKINSSLGSN